MPQSWYQIRALADSVEISIYEDIGAYGISSAAFLDELKAVGNRPITLRIDSLGGDVFQGFAIYNRLREHTAGVTVKIDGLAASMASVIAMAGTRVEIAATAFMMIHNPAIMGPGGEADQLRQKADILDMVKENLITAYAQKTGLPRAKLARMMDETTYLDAATAVALGFADVLSVPLQIAARFDTSRLPNAPAQFAAHFKPNTQDMKLSAAALNFLASALGSTLTEASSAADIEQAITALGTRNATLEADLATARTTHGTLNTAHEALTAQFTTLTTEATAANEARAAADLVVTNLNAEVANLKTAGTNDKASIKRLEALCSLKGIDPNAAAPSLVPNDESAVALYDRFTKAKSTDATAMLNDPKTGPLIRAESQRRHAAA